MSTSRTARPKAPTKKPTTKAPTKKPTTRTLRGRQRPVSSLLYDAAHDAHRLVHMAQYDPTLRDTQPQPLRVLCLRYAERALDEAWKAPAMVALELAFLDMGGAGATFDPAPTPEAPLPTVERVHDLLHAALTMLDVETRHDFGRRPAVTSRERLAAFLCARSARDGLMTAEPLLSRAMLACALGLAGMGGRW